MPRTILGVLMNRNAEDERTLHYLSDEHRTEWKRLEFRSKTGGTLVAWITILSLVASAVLALATVLALMNPLTGEFIVLGIATVIVFLGGDALSKPLARRAKSRAGSRMQALRELARTSPVHRTAEAPGRSDCNDGTNWARYPVTGTYNPELYHARGGRSTATGMANWGVDYETYRSNIE